MKKPLSIALAATIAVSAIGLSAAPASAHRDDRAALAIFGAIAGIAAVAAASQHHDHYYYDDGYRRPYDRYPHYRRSYYNSHVQWCLDHYRTYNPATNTYFRKPGVPAACYSPY